ncbi:MAG: hypothetical protein KJT03_02210, partial [Verrucomicrobiae bacterium]|nr:hypothetical protein [Verrucomicrobiae bacterium]
EGENIANNPLDLKFRTNPSYIPYTHRFRGEGLQRFNFESSQEGAQNLPGDVLIFLDDVTFNNAPVLKNELKNVYITEGSPFHLVVDPVAVNGPVSVRWYHNGEFLGAFENSLQFAIESVDSTDAGTYEIRLSEPGSLESTESFELILMDPLQEVLKSNQEDYMTSFAEDWEVVSLESEEGEFALVGDKRKGPRPYRDSFSDGRIYISTGANGSGIFRLRARTDRYFDYINRYPELTLTVDGVEVWNYQFKTLDWVEHEIQFRELGSRRIELKFRAVSDINMSKLYLDEFSFTPDLLTSDAPTSKFVYSGDRVTYDLTSVTDPEDPVTYCWFRGDDLIETNAEGTFEIPSVGLDDFGGYRLKIESQSGLENEYPFQIVDASLLNEALKAPGLKFFGEFTGALEFSTMDETAHLGHLSIQAYNSDQPISGAFSAIIDGPGTLRLDAKQTAEGVQTPLKLSVANEEILKINSSDWESLEACVLGDGPRQVDWVFSPDLGEGASISLDGLEIDHRPSVIGQSPSNDMISGSPVLLGAQVLGAEGGDIQWFKDGKILSGEQEPYLIATAVGQADAGHYQVIAENQAGAVLGDPIRLGVQDDFGNVFPYHSWNWRAVERDQLSTDEDVRYGVGPSVQVRPQLDADIRPGFKFNILGPRIIDLTSLLPDARTSYFLTRSGERESKSGSVSSVVWGKNSLTIDRFGISEVTVELVNYNTPLSGEYENRTGYVGSIKARWPEDSSLARWIKWALPYSWETIHDLDLIFGDVDRDGVKNIFEYATLSSAVTPGSNIWVNRGPDGRDESIHFYKPYVLNFPFEYALEASPNLVNWERIPSVLESEAQVIDNYKIFCRIQPDPAVVLPEGRCFLRLVVSTDFYLPAASN